MSVKVMNLAQIKGITPSPVVRYKLNVSPLLNPRSGWYEPGENNSMILNGGIMPFTAWCGEGNTYKSTIMNSIALKIHNEHPLMSLSTYDTEGNFDYNRMESLSKRYANIKDLDFTEPELSRYTLISSIEMDGDKWFEYIRDFGEARIAAKEVKGTTPFVDVKSGNSKKLIKALYPAVHLMDSLSEFQTESSKKQLEDNDIDSGKLNMYWASSANQKSKLVHEMPKVFPRSDQFLICTAHISEFMQTGPTPERKRLTRMRQGYKIKNVPKNFEFLTHHCWEITKSEYLFNSAKNGPMFPSSKTNRDEKEDQFRVHFHGLRVKDGPSGIPLFLIVSQALGVLWDLSHYYHLITFNIGVKQQGHGYTIDLYPGKMYMRTNIRDELDDDPKLRRAVELTCEIAIARQYREELMQVYRDFTFDQLYQGLVEKGYDWDKIYDTRGYWVFKEEEPLIPDLKPYLSGLDLLRMYTGEYNPTWLKKAK